MRAEDVLMLTFITQSYEDYVRIIEQLNDYEVQRLLAILFMRTEKEVYLHRCVQASPVNQIAQLN